MGPMIIIRCNGSRSLISWKYNPVAGFMITACGAELSAVMVLLLLFAPTVTVMVIGPSEGWHWMFVSLHVATNPS